MKRSAILLAGVALVAACNKEPKVSVDNATGAEVANELADAGGADSFVSPGQWESRVTIEQMSMPGMPPEMANQVQGMAARAEVHQSCLTEEEAKRPKEDFFAGDNKNCRYDHFRMGGGKIDAVMRCADEGRTHVMSMQGTYSADSYNMRMKMDGSGGGDENAMSMTMRVDAKRVGPCKDPE